MEEAEFSGSFLFSGWRVCLWRGEEWRDGSPIAPEAAETSCPAPKRLPFGAIPQGQKSDRSLRRRKN